MGRETSLFYIDVKSDESSVSSTGVTGGPASLVGGGGVGGGGPGMGHSRSGSFGGGPQQSIPTSMPNLVWNPLIETSFQLGRVSREEELQLERKRCAAFGITNYELDPKSGSFVFPAAGSLFSCTDSDSSKQTSTHFHEVINIHYEKFLTGNQTLYGVYWFKTDSGPLTSLVSTMLE